MKPLSLRIPCACDQKHVCSANHVDMEVYGTANTVLVNLNNTNRPTIVFSVTFNCDGNNRGLAGGKGSNLEM